MADFPVDADDVVHVEGVDVVVIDAVDDDVVVDDDVIVLVVD